MAAAALAIAGAGSAAGEPDVPTFAPPAKFPAPGAPGPIAATPPGFDLVGSEDSGDLNEPDGFPEIAVAGNEGDDAGKVWFYRNNSSTIDPGVELQFLLEVNVFSEIGVNFTTDNAYITDILLANLTDNDDDPDLIVAVSYIDLDNPPERLGKVATFRSERTFGVLSYIYVDDVDLDYPVTGLTSGAYSTDGRQQVLAACEDSDASGSAPSRIFVLENTDDINVAPNYGKLVHIGDLATNPMGSNPTRSIVSGQFSNLVLGSGGTTLDFAAFGAGSSGVTLGIGNGIGAFTFTMNPVLGAACNGSPIIGFGTGIAGSGPTNTAPIIYFDPFSNVKKSLATTDGVGVSLIHVDPRFGSFTHLCDGEVSLDYYPMTPEDCSEPEALLNSVVTSLASGHFNNDTYEDLVYIDPRNGNVLESAFAAFLLGRGAPGTDGRIMYFSNCVDLIKPHYVPYEASENGGVDHVMSVNLNNEGFDEVLITRSRTWELIVLENTTGN